MRRAARQIFESLEGFGATDDEQNVVGFDAGVASGSRGMELRSSGNAPTAPRVLTKATPHYRKSGASVNERKSAEY
jgi:hypothetical protein